MNETEKDLRISNIFYYLLRGRRLIAIFAIVGLIVGIILSGVAYLRGEMSKEYKITSSIAIIAKTKSGTYASSNLTPDTQDVRLAQEITDSAIYVLKSERTLRAAIDYAGLTGITVKDIAGNLTLKQYNETQIIEMALDWRSSAEGVKILEAINAVSGEILLETLQIGNVSVVNSPSSKYVIGGKVSASTWIIGAILGAGVAMALCILKLFVSPLLTNVVDFERSFSIKVLNSIPYEKKFGDSVPFAKDGTRAKKAIISLSHILSNSMDSKGFKKVIITSTIRGEGKTSLTANIAQQMSFMEKKTLMVDCDFSNPMLSSMFEGQIPYEKTLNAVYRGDADETDAVTHISGCLDLLPVTLSDNAINLNDSMLEIIDKIAARYDYVLLDCAPIGMEAEVIKVRKIADTSLFVARFDYADLDSIENALLRLTGSGIDVVGAVVTSVKTIKDVLRETQKLSLFMRNARKRAEKQERTASKKASKKAKKNKKRKNEE